MAWQHERTGKHSGIFSRTIASGSYHEGGGRASGPAMTITRSIGYGRSGARVGASTSKVTSYAGMLGKATPPSVSSHGGSMHLGYAAAGLAGVGAAAYGGYKAYQHRDEIKQKASAFGGHVHDAFHSTRHMIGAH